jgi:hypothetical protein
MVMLMMDLNQNLNLKGRNDMFEKIMRFFKRPKREKPDMYAIFVWMRQVNERLLALEENKTVQSVAERAESETRTESITDRLEARIVRLEADNVRT